MVDVDQALNWLNAESATRISPATQSRIDNFSMPGLSPAQRRATVLALLRTASTLPDPYEQAEVYAHSGVFFYRLMQLDESIHWLQHANKKYEELRDAHRQACTSWMLFRVMRSSGKYRRAFDRGKSARTLFHKKEFQYHQLMVKKWENWYQSRQIDLTFDLISTPEDSFEWLFEFNGSRMSHSAMQVKDQAQEHIERRLFDEADRDIQILLEITSKSQECAETAEAMAYSGVAEWVMEHQMNALYYFRSALAQYIPNPHEYAILTWMLGLAEWSFPDLRARSVATMEKAIRKVEELREEAGRHNETIKREWYAMHFNAMRRVLTHLIV